MTGKIPTFFILIGVATLITLATLSVIKNYNKVASPDSKTISGTERIVVDPKKVVAPMEKRLGPEWTKIKTIKGKWYGPYRMKNGSDWKVATGEVWVKVDKQRPFLDKPNTNPIVSGREIKFSPATDTATIFYCY